MQDKPIVLAWPPQRTVYVVSRGNLRAASVHARVAAVLSVIALFGCGGEGAMVAAQARAVARPSPALNIARKSLTVIPGPPLRGVTQWSSPFPVRDVLTSLPAAGREHIWLATPAGLLHYQRGPSMARQGALFLRRGLTIADGLPSLAVNALQLDPDRRMTVATDRGVVQLDAGQETIRAPIWLKGTRVTALADRYAGTWNGVHRLLANGRSRLIPETRDAQVTALRRCGLRLHIGTHDRGLLIWDGRRLRPTPGMPQTPVVQLSRCQPDGVLYAATVRGVFRVQRAQAAVLSAWRTHATAVAVEHTGAVLVGSFGDGVCRAERSQCRTLLAGCRVRGVYPLSATAPQEVLIATDESLELVRLVDEPSAAVAADVRPKPFPGLNGPPSGLVTAILTRDESTYVGTFDNGLGLLAAGTWKRIPGFEQRITALATGPDDSILVGTASGLGRISDGRVVRVADPKGWTRGRHINFMRSTRDALYVGVHPGLAIVSTDGVNAPSLSWRYRAADPSSASSGLPGSTIFGVWPLRNGLFAAGKDGLGWSAADQSWVIDGFSPALPGPWVNDVRGADDEIADDEVYVLPLRGGVAQLRGRDWTFWDAPMIASSPGAMLVRDRQVYWGTNRQGLAIFERPAANASHLDARTFGPEQGLASATVSAIHFDPITQRLMVGGDRGITVISKLEPLVRNVSTAIQHVLLAAARKRGGLAVSA